MDSPSPSSSCCDSAGSAYVPQPDGDAQLASLCRALGHPHRVTILRFLLAQDTCFAGELAELLPVAASTASQHLATLRHAGLIRGEVDGPRRCYCVEPDAVAALKTLVEGL
ncbi:MAG: winged helix-turn-helix transcriptional regulator [Oligoflexia bacterium]|nr:winged helix-turn-helix transcriptional regulator [Oligoflexia bacterium]